MPSPIDLDLDALRAALHASLDPGLLSREYRDRWSPDNPTAGLCSVASEAAWFLLGGKAAGWMACVAQDPAGGTHWWLEHPGTGQRFDPTREQYDSRGVRPPYERGMASRATGFMGIRRDEGNAWGVGYRPSRRATALLARVLVEIKASSPEDARSRLARHPAASRSFRPARRKPG